MLASLCCRFTCLIALLWAATSPAGEESLAHHIPAGAIAALEGQQLGEVIRRLEQSELVKSLAGSPGYRQFLDSDPGRKFMAGLAILQAQYGKDVWSIARDLVGDRWIVAVYPPETGGPPKVVALIRTESPEVVTHLRGKLEPLLPLAGDNLKTEPLDGGLRLVNSDGASLILTGRWIAFSNAREQLDRVEAGLKSPLTDSLAATETFRKSQSSLQSNSQLQAWVDLSLIRKVIHKDQLLPAKLDNPLVSLLLGGVLAYVSQADSGTAELQVTESDWNLQAFIPGAAVAISTPQQSLLPPRNSSGIQLDRQLAAFSLVRDWAQWYEQRESLLIDRLLPEFDKFETGLATFLPGKDFRTDVLPLFGQRLQFVSAPQSFAHLEGRPGVQLPAFAVLLELQKPDEASDILQMAFQTITAVVNLNAAQEKRTPWVMSSETYQGVQISFAKYLQQPKGTDLPVAFNFQPSAARSGNQFILATSQEMCRQVIDALQSPAESRPTESAERRDWRLELSPVIASSLLEANRAILEAKAVQDGNSAEIAKGNLDLAIDLLQRLTPISLSSTLRPEGYLWRLEGGWSR